VHDSVSKRKTVKPPIKTLPFNSMAEPDNPAIALPTEPKKETQDTPKRKREDNIDDEGEAIRHPSEKRRRLRVPLEEETEPSPLPTPYSSHEVYIKVNLENSLSRHRRNRRFRT
jgi:hypothetical protein